MFVFLWIASRGYRLGPWNSPYLTMACRDVRRNTGRIDYGRILHATSYGGNAAPYVSIWVGCGETGVCSKC